MFTTRELTWLVRLRERELNIVLEKCPGMSGRLLEIGGGTGHQALALTRHCREVCSIDIEQTGGYADHRVFPVQPYDGRRIPFPDGSFDVVFSSNVLEHIAPIDDFEKELHRVLKQSGRAVHVIPTHSWRLWTALAHAPAMAKVVPRAVVRRAESFAPTLFSRDQIPAPSPAVSSEPLALPRRRSLSRDLSMLVGWGPHGERGNSLSEILYYFRPSWWEHHFRASGWTIERKFPIGLFYTGHALAGERLSLAQRGRWARVVGSSTFCFELSHAARPTANR